jgi:hypothetical protein
MTTYIITGTFDSITEMIEHLQSLDHPVTVVANPNIEAVTKVAKHRMPFIDWSTADAVIQELVAAALTSGHDKRTTPND